MAKFTKGDDARDIRATLKPVGCTDIDTPRGPIHVCEAPGLLSCTVHADGDDKPATAISIIVYDPKPMEGMDKGRALMAQIDAPGAREIAASLLKLADMLDPMVPN